MDTTKLTEALAQTIRASGIPGDRVRPARVARWFGVTPRQARAACRRLARRGTLISGRTA